MQNRLVYLGILVLFSCKAKLKSIKIKNEECIKIDFFSKSQVELNNFSAPKIIQLKSKDSSFFIASIEKFVKFRDNIFILDERYSNIIRLDTLGNYLNTYGSIGFKNEEYSKVNDFEIDSSANAVIVLSNDDRAFYYYDLKTSKFIKKIRTNIYGESFSKISNNGILMYRNFSTEDKIKNYNIVRLDSLGKSKSKGLEFNPKISTMGWKSSGFLKTINGEALISSPFSDTVFRFYNDSLIPSILFKIVDDSLKKYRFEHKRLFSSGIMLDTNTSFLCSKLTRNERYIVFEHQFEKKLCLSVYDILKNKLYSINRKNQLNPIFSLGLTPLYIDKDNTLYLKFTKKNALYLKTKNPILFNKLSNENKIILNDSTQKSGAFLVSFKITDNE
jgi:hypothetical protein